MRKERRIFRWITVWILVKLFPSRCPSVFFLWIDWLIDWLIMLCLYETHYIRSIHWLIDWFKFSFRTHSIDWLMDWLIDWWFSFHILSFLPWIRSNITRKFLSTSRFFFMRGVFFQLCWWADSLLWGIGAGAVPNHQQSESGLHDAAGEIERFLGDISGRVQQHRKDRGWREGRAGETDWPGPAGRSPQSLSLGQETRREIGPALKVPSRSQFESRSPGREGFQPQRRQTRRPWHGTKPRRRPGAIWKISTQVCFSWR